MKVAFSQQTMDRLVRRLPARVRRWCARLPTVLYLGRWGRGGYWGNSTWECIFHGCKQVFDPIFQVEYCPRVHQWRPLTKEKYDLIRLALGDTSLVENHADTEEPIE